MGLVLPVWDRTGMEADMRGWIAGRTPYITLAAAVLGLVGLLGLNAALAEKSAGSGGPPALLAPVSVTAGSGATSGIGVPGDVNA